MSKKDEFKLFVQNHPELIKYVNNNEMTWQKFFDIYSLYGEDNKVWDNYFKEETNNEKLSFSEFMNTLKKVDVDSLQKNINNINKGLALIESLFVKKDNPVSDYTPRPLYKKFED